jgi:hypothetical protein
MMAGIGVTRGVGFVNSGQLAGVLLDLPGQNVRESLFCSLCTP